MHTQSESPCFCSQPEQAITFYFFATFTLTQTTETAATAAALSSLITVIQGTCYLFSSEKIAAIEMSI